jgi:hypothetical protein
MKVTVYALRERGRRTRKVEMGEGVEGELQMASSMHGSEMHVVVRLCSRAALSIHDHDLLPPLYSPELIAIAREAMLLRGFESNDGAAYVQEWRCVVGV